MRKLVLIIIVSIVSGNAFGQLSLGVGYIKAGQFRGDANQGLYTGADFNLRIGNSFGIAPGVYYSIGKSTYPLYYSDGTVAKKYEEHYIGFPINLNYSIRLSSSVSLCVFSGPMFSYGTISTETNVTNNSSTGKTQDLYGFLPDNVVYSPFDISFGGGLALCFKKRVRLSLGFNFGFLNRATGDNVHYYHRGVFHSGIAYSF